MSVHGRDVESVAGMGRGGTDAGKSCAAGLGMG
jgi:hypothetical protein